MPSIFAGFKNKVLILLSIFILGWLGVIIYNSLQKQSLLKEELAQFERNRAEIIGRNEDIQTQLEQLQDPAFLEKEARRKFSYQKEGEKVVIFVESATGSVVSVKQIETEGSFTNLKNWFKFMFYKN